MLRAIGRFLLRLVSKKHRNMPLPLSKSVKKLYEVRVSGHADDWTTSHPHFKFFVTKRWMPNAEAKINFQVVFSAHEVHKMSLTVSILNAESKYDHTEIEINQLEDILEKFGDLDYYTVTSISDLMRVIEYPSEEVFSEFCRVYGRKYTALCDQNGNVVNEYLEKRRGEKIHRT